MPCPFVEQVGRVGVGEGRLAEMGGGLAAIELDGRRPEAPDGVEGRPVGIQEHRDASGRGPAR